MTGLFQRDRTVITKHINNIFSEGELDEKSNVQKMHIAFSDKPVTLYSLDVIISVGYRVKSQQGTQFRQWATQKLKEYLVQGYTINQKRLEQLQKIVEVIQRSGNSEHLQLCLICLFKSSSNSCACTSMLWRLAWRNSRLTCSASFSANSARFLGSAQRPAM